MKQLQAHTPAPWQQQTGGIISADAGLVADADPIGSGRLRPVAERRANASLISAAPDLAAALLLALQDAFGEGWTLKAIAHNIEAKPGIPEWQTLALAALKKAALL